MKLTDKQTRLMQSELERAVSIVGGQSAMAEKIGTSQQVVHLWLRSQKKARAEFVLAIEAATGSSSAWEAAGKLYDKEMGLFAFDDHWHGNDVLHLLGETEAQCADDAAMLSAMMRAVGIPAHPVTSDLNQVAFGGMWSFDTWAEALAPGSQGTAWYVYHPHEGWGRQTRHEAAGHNVSRKSNVDVIIMSGPNWTASEVRDRAVDLEFRYFTYDGSGNIVPCSQGAGRPLAEFDFAQPWIVDLSEPYWGVPHEDPPVPEDPPLVTIELDELTYTAGDTMHGTVTVSNPSTSDVSGEVALTVVGDVLESMLWPDVLLCEYSIAVTVTAGSSTSLAFDCPLPGDAGSHLVYTAVAVWQGERAATTFEVETSYEVALSAPTSAAQFDPFIAAVTVTNLSGGTVSGLTGTLVPTAELELLTPTATIGPADIPTGSSLDLEWQLQGLTVSDVAQVRLILESSNGGSTELQAGLEVTQGPARPDLVIGNEDVLMLPGVPRDDSPIEFFVTVHNHGGADAPEVGVRFMLDGGVEDETTVALAMGASEGLWFGLSPTPGIHDVSIVVDPDGLVAESDESNNSWQRDLTIGLPDFAFHAVQCWPEDPVPGQPVSVLATVINRGSQTTQYLLDIEVRCHEVALASTTIDLRDIGYEAPLYTWPVWFYFALPAEATELCVIVDPGDSFEEWDEQNNDFYVGFLPTDVTPPDLAVSVEPDLIWPPDHRYVEILPSITVSDDQDPSPVVVLESVTIFEDAKVGGFDPSSGWVVGAGHTENDVVVTPEGRVFVRAERSGTGSGRTYVISYRATDAAGNSATASAEVFVPHHHGGAS